MQLHRTYYLGNELNRTNELEKQRNKMNGQKYKTAEPKTHKKQQEHQAKTQEHKLTKTIERGERKERRISLEDGRMMDDLATRSVECS